MGGEGGEEEVRGRRRQGALTSPARHAGGSRPHVPRAARAGSTRLRRACARAPGSGAPSSGVRSFVPAHARPILTDGARGPPVANRRARPASPAPSGPGGAAPRAAHAVWACAAARLFFGVQQLLGGFLCDCGSPPPPPHPEPARSLRASGSLAVASAPICCWAVGSPKAS